MNAERSRGDSWVNRKTIESLDRDQNMESYK